MLAFESDKIADRDLQKLNKERNTRQKDSSTSQGTLYPHWDMWNLVEHIYMSLWHEVLGNHYTHMTHTKWIVMSIKLHAFFAKKL